MTITNFTLSFVVLRYELNGAAGGDGGGDDFPGGTGGRGTKKTGSILVQTTAATMYYLHAGLRGGNGTTGANEGGG